MKAAANVPVELFNIVNERFGYGRETYSIEESSTVAEVAGVDPEKSGVTCAISLERFTRGGREHAIFRLWPKKPEREAWLIYAAKPILSIHGGPAEDGVGIRGRAEGGEVILNYGHYSSVSLSVPWGQKILPFMAVVLAEATKLTGPGDTWSDEAMGREQPPAP